MRFGAVLELLAEESLRKENERSVEYIPGEAEIAVTVGVVEVLVVLVEGDSWEEVVGMIVEVIGIVVGAVVKERDQFI